MKRGELEPLDLRADLAMKKKYAPQLCTILEAATASASYLSEQRAAKKKLKQGKPHRDRRRTKGTVEKWRSGREFKAYVSRRSEKKDDGVAYLLDHIVNLHSNGAHQILTQLHLYLTAERVNHGQSHSSQGHDSHFGIAASYETTYRLAHHMSRAYVTTFPERMKGR